MLRYPTTLRKGSLLMGDIKTKVDHSYESKSFTELANAPVSALQGVSDSDAALLLQAFGIKTVRDLGTNKFFLWAQAISKIAD